MGSPHCRADGLWIREVEARHHADKAEKMCVDLSAASRNDEEEAARIKGEQDELCQWEA